MTSKALAVIPQTQRELLPPILAGHATPAIAKRVAHFYESVAEIFERWAERCESPHTQRAYRQDFMAFVRHMDFEWPAKAPVSGDGRSLTLPRPEGGEPGIPPQTSIAVPTRNVGKM